jgi:serine/threonine protein kinase
MSQPPAPSTFSRAELSELMTLHAGAARVPARFKVITDTSDFFRVDYNDVVMLGGEPFWVKGYEKEGRFGMDDEPKYWVRRAVQLQDGTSYILKLVFHESFETRIGGVVINCFRSPGKEARILDLVRHHPNFMHGHWVLDQAGNNVRILEIIRGRRYDQLIDELVCRDHAEYFHRDFPKVLAVFIEMTRAIKFLHDQGEKHGDIRRDHILWDHETETPRWIDFDYNYQHGESMFGFDLHGLGNLLIFLAGRGDVVTSELQQQQPDLYDRLTSDDLGISYQNRVANLKKIYPYIPDSLNLVLRHFSQGAGIFYENTGQMLKDLAVAQADLEKLAGGA